MCSIAVEDLSLRGCLIARYGHGIVFLEGQDPVDEQRFSLAHELAHFLRHYWLPRQHLVMQLGPAVLDVLDGDRLPTHEERVHALLARVRVGYFIHLMNRSRDSWPDRATTTAAELEADLLAFELLAPSREVIRAISDVSDGDRRSVATHHLRTKYGLPDKAAERYACILCPGPSGGHSLLHRLGLAHVELSASGAEEKMQATGGGE
ncbi:ImmA/IrrE family metallo-endopeptidase [Thermalbibacter longus]|uniref:ImmA/IrrE family metallo-endopeptidase n=1 Tax=Thermalbibacter longus TaxID=2951981 RepID=UPI003D368237